MKKYTFGFYPNGNLAEISVIAETRVEAVRLVRTMISDKRYFNDGLFLNDVEEYKG